MLRAASISLAAIALSGCYLSHQRREGADAGVACTDHFQTETIEHNRVVSPVVRIGADGVVHIAYLAPYGPMRHAWAAPGEPWNIETIVESDDLCCTSSLALAPDGSVHACYDELGDSRRVDSTTTTLASRGEDGTWTHELVTVGVGGCQMVIDEASVVHIAEVYWLPGFVGLGYRHRHRPLAGGDWTLETIDTQPTDGSGGSASRASLALGPGGELHTAFTPLSNAGRGFTYAVRRGGSWIVEHVDGAARGEGVSIAIDGAGMPHVAYEDPIDDRLATLRYATRAADGTWSAMDVGESDPMGFTSIAIDDRGRVHIVFSAQGALRYARYDAGAWSIDVIDSIEGADPIESSIAIGAGRLHVAYGAAVNETTNPIDHAWLCL